MSSEETPSASSPQPAHFKVILKLLAVLFLLALLMAVAVWPWLNSSVDPRPVPPVTPVPRAHWREAKWRNFSDDAKLVSLAQLTHNDRSLFERLLRFDAKAREIAAPTWFHVPYTHSGNYIKAGWSSHIHRDNRLGWPWQRPPAGEARFISVATLCYPQDPTKAFGIQLEAEYVPAYGWGARVSYYDGAQSRIFGRAASVIFFHRGQRYDDGLIISLPADQLPQVLATPEALRDFAIGRIEEDLRMYEVHLAADKLQHSEPDMKQYRGDGIPPPEIGRPYTAAEKQMLLAQRRARDEERIQALRGDHQEMYEAMIRAFPLHECW